MTKLKKEKAMNKIIKKIAYKENGKNILIENDYRYIKYKYRNLKSKGFKNGNFISIQSVETENKKFKQYNFRISIQHGIYYYEILTNILPKNLLK